MRRSTFLKQLLGGAAAVGVGATLDIDMGGEPEASTADMTFVSGRFEVSMQVDKILKEGHSEALRHELRRRSALAVRAMEEQLRDQMRRSSGTIIGITTT